MRSPVWLESGALLPGLYGSFSLRQTSVRNSKDPHGACLDHFGENAMLNRLSSYAFAVPLAFLLATGYAFAQDPGAQEIRQGVIEQITPVQLQSNQHRGVGAIVGGLGGLGIGSLIGGGTGRDVAMVAGALGGALFGNNIQKRYDQPVPGQQIIVRVKSGVLVAVTQAEDPNLRIGQAVYIEGSGEGARVIPQ